MGRGDLKWILTTFDKIPPLGGWDAHTWGGGGLKMVLTTFDKIPPLGGWACHTLGGLKLDSHNL